MERRKKRVKWAISVEKLSIGKTENSLESVNTLGAGKSSSTGLIASGSSGIFHLNSTSVLLKLCMRWIGLRSFRSTAFSLQKQRVISLLSLIKERVY